MGLSLQALFAYLIGIKPALTATELRQTIVKTPHPVISSPPTGIAVVMADMSRHVITSLLQLVANGAQAAIHNLEGADGRRLSQLQNHTESDCHQGNSSTRHDATEESTRAADNEETNRAGSRASKVNDGRPNGSRSLRFSMDAPKLIQIPAADGSVTAVKMPKEVFEQIPAIFQSRRDLVALDKHLDQEWDALTAREVKYIAAIAQLEAMVDELQAKMDGTEGPGDESLTKKLQRARTALELANHERDELKEKGDSLNDQKFGALKQHVHLSQHLEAAFETAFVKNGFFKPPRETDETSPRGFRLEDYPGYASSDSAPGSGNSAIGAGRSATPHEPGLERPDWQDLSDERQRVAQRLAHARWALDQAEQDLACYVDGDKAEVTFDSYQRYMRYEKGIEVTSEDFGKHQYAELQKFTRGLVDAEAAYQEAKAKAKPLGVNLKHEIDSVLSDWTDDGYMWMKDDEERRVFMSGIDHSSVLRWLQDLESLAEREDAEGYCRTDVEHERRLASADGDDSKMDEVDNEETGSVEARKPFLSISMRAGDIYASRRECEQRRVLIRRWNQQIGHY